jgi:hypothetical protein
VTQSPVEIMKARLFAAAEAYADAKGIKLTSVGMYATKDSTLFDRISAGGMCSARVYDRVMAWMSDNWPDGVSWPKGVPRPARTKPKKAKGGDDAGHTVG